MHHWASRSTGRPRPGGEASAKVVATAVGRRPRRVHPGPAGSAEGAIRELRHAPSGAPPDLLAFSAKAELLHFPLRRRRVAVQPGDDVPSTRVTRSRTAPFRRANASRQGVVLERRKVTPEGDPVRLTPSDDEGVPQWTPLIQVVQAFDPGNTTKRQEWTYAKSPPLSSGWTMLGKLQRNGCGGFRGGSM